jgi:hypothetical protein
VGIVIDPSHARTAALPIEENAHTVLMITITFNRLLIVFGIFRFPLNVGCG